MRSVVGRARAAADILRSDWDPIGVSGLPANEYDSYAPCVIELIAVGASDLHVAAHLSAIARDRMGLGTRAPETLLPVAGKLRDAVVGEALSERLIANGNAQDPRLEAFIGERLFEGGHWPTAREGDGVREVRVLLDGPWCARMIGELWTIDQKRHVFWLDLEADGPDRIGWRLSYDVVTSARRERSALHGIDRPEDERWRVELSGRMSR